LQDLVTKYADFVMDPHMSTPFEVWLQAVVLGEMIFQLPFFFIAVRMLSDDQREQYPRWFQMASIIYGSHTATTLIPILATIWFRDEEQEAPLHLRVLCLTIYLPYLIFPAWLAWIAASDEEDSNYLQRKQVKVT
jgi:hypothetical protein